MRFSRIDAREMKTDSHCESVFISLFLSSLVLLWFLRFFLVTKFALGHTL
jgi:hypothetical protein